MKPDTKSRSLAAVCGGLLSALLCGAAGAIEIPLEGFGKTASVAYINMHKIFEAFPETERARIELNELIYEKKADITDRKEEIARLRAEIEFLKRQMSAVNPSAAPGERPAEQPAGPAPDASLTLPPNSPLSFLFGPTAGSTAAPAVDPGTVGFSTFNAQTPQILPGIPSPAPQLAEKEAALTAKAADLEVFVAEAESEVRRMEEGKTLTLMARIYETIQEVAAKDGYSVIVDRENILYGDSATDITETVIWRLSNPSKGRKRAREEEPETQIPIQDMRLPQDNLPPAGGQPAPPTETPPTAQPADILEPGPDVYPPATPPGELPGDTVQPGETPPGENRPEEMDTTPVREPAPPPESPKEP